MTTTENDRLKEFYFELNNDHEVLRDALLVQLPKTSTIVSRRTSVDTPQGGRITRRLWLGSGVAAALLITGVFVLRPRDVWAEVVDAVRSKNWIHFVSRDMDGKVSEIWESPSAEISASKSATQIRLMDKSTSLMHVYYPLQNKVVRLELKNQMEADSMQQFMELLLGDTERLRHIEVVDRQQRTISEGGRTWTEILLVVQPIGGTRMAWNVRIDPSTHLPLTLQAELADGSKAKQPLFEGKFDYPSEGPTTLTAIGVPADAKSEDSVPKESLTNILAEMKTQRKNLGAYHLRISEGAGSRLWYEAWKDGAKWRQDLQQPDICDGKQWWSKHLGTWKMMKKIPNSSTEEFCRLNAQWFYLENLTYPFLTATPEFDLVVQKDRADGPIGCILVERIASPGADPKLVHRYTPRREQYWLDPSRNFALVKRVLTDIEAPESECHSKGIAKHIESTYEDFKQSPSGVWFPTTIKTTGTIWVKQINPIIVEPLDQHWKVDVDFSDSIPNDLFEIDAAKKRSM